MKLLNLAIEVVTNWTVKAYGTLVMLGGTKENEIWILVHHFLTYLMRLNTLVGRSYNDISQYPVLPPILGKDGNSTGFVVFGPWFDSPTSGPLPHAHWSIE